MPLIFRLILAALCMFAGASAANAQTDFYRAPRSEVAGAPGTLVRQEVIDGAPLGATAYRVLYRSTGLDNKPSLVSGVVIVPPGDPPARGRPIVAWAHPTSGVVPRCAPSLAIFLFEQIQGLRSFIRDGYVVAATDYPGLGTEGPHPYLVGTSEARAVIDSVRVAGSLPGAGGGKKFVVWGHSQGGHAALFSGIIAKTYAPELDLLGVAAAAPATDLATLMNEDIDSVGGKNITAMTLWSWQRVFDANMEKVIDPRAKPAIDRLAQECIEGPFDLRRRQLTEQPLAYAVGDKFARCVVARDSGFPCARRRRCHRSPRRDQGLRCQAVQGWQQGAHAVDAEHRSRQGGAGQHPGDVGMGRRPVCRSGCSRRLRAMRLTGGAPRAGKPPP
jgi:Secretory lipase